MNWMVVAVALGWPQPVIFRGLSRDTAHVLRTFLEGLGAYVLMVSE
jgi:hypothetical protein